MRRDDVADDDEQADPAPHAPDAPDWLLVVSVLAMGGVLYFIFPIYLLYPFFAGP